jgi:hypothetical protein
LWGILNESKEESKEESELGEESKEREIICKAAEERDTLTILIQVKTM